MAQEIDHIDRTARQYVLDGFTLFRQLEQEQRDAEASGDDLKLAHALAGLDEIDAYTLANRAETILLGLGFANTDYDKAVADFSGGWRIRLNLARTLFSPSDLLLLDEPTNHLDIEAIHFLEQWISQYQGAVLLVSHDRDFIDGCCNRLVHIEQTVFTVYSGNYSAFERQRAEHMQHQQGLLVKQQRRQKELQGFIDRFRAQATKAKQAQSRIKALEKMQTIQVVREQSPYQFKIPCSEKVSSPLISWSKVDVGYNDTAIVSACNFSINPGQRVGLLGANGAGKSTVIKTLAADQGILHGDESFGEHLKIGYFAQHQLEALDLDASAILHIQRLSPTAREQDIRDFLGSFSIKGDQATDAIGPFSGGEKARLALAIVAWQKPNVLLLDEPTNHLDIAMREALADALQAYQGAVILISHDRYLLRHCVDDFYLVEDGKLAAFAGDIDDYYALRDTKDKVKSSTSDSQSENTQPQKNRPAPTPQRSENNCHR
jgi:ATP-binding cassette subfamily F protein 3